MPDDGPQTGANPRPAGAPEPAPVATADAGPMRYITCRFCGHDNPTGGDACENCGAEFSEGMPEPATAFDGGLLGAPLESLVSAAALWLDAGTGALAAVERMKADGVDCVLVGDGRRLAGIFTDRDAMLKLPGLAGPAPTLGEVMTPDPVVLRPDDTVAVGIHKMAVAEIRHVPLVGEAGIRGVIAARDLFRHFASRRGKADAGARASARARTRGQAGDGRHGRSGATLPPRRPAASTD